MAPGFNHEAYWLMRAARKLQEPQEKAFMTGTGANQPLGIFTAHSEGIPTSRDVSTGNTSTAITAQGVMAAFYSLKAQYMRNARFVLHRQAVRQLRELTANGQFLWQPGLGRHGAGHHSRPTVHHESEYAPSTFTTGQYVGVVGDFSKYWIVDSAQMMVQRLSELYAETNQTGLHSPGRDRRGAGACRSVCPHPARIVARVAKSDFETDVLIVRENV